MAKSKKNPEAESDSHWIGYSDLSTALMLVFILLLVSMLLLQKRQEEQRTKEIERILAEIEETLQRSDRLGQKLADELEKGGCPVEWKQEEQRFVFKELKDNFRPLGFKEEHLKPATHAKLMKCGDTLQGFLENTDNQEFVKDIDHLVVEGLTDSQAAKADRDRFLGNLILSSKRTQTVVRLLLGLGKKQKSQPRDEYNLDVGLDKHDLRRFIAASGRSFADFDAARQDAAGDPEKLWSFCPDRDNAEKKCSKEKILKGECSCYRRFDIKLRLKEHEWFNEIRKKVMILREEL